MTEQAADIQASEDGIKVSKPMLSQGIHLGFLVFGALVSLGLFLAVQSVTQSILENDYQRISRDLSQKLVKQAVELQYSFKTIGTLLALSEVEEHDLVLKKMERLKDSFQGFETVLWMYKTGDAWDMRLLHQMDNKSEKRSMLALLKSEHIQNSLIESARNKDELFFVPVLHKANAGDNAFALVKAINTQDGGYDILIGASRFQRIFDTSSVDVDGLVSQLSVHNIATGNTLFDYKGKGKLTSAEYSNPQNFDFQIADQTLEITSVFFKKDDMILLDILPYIVLGFGLVMTVTITLYLRTHHMKALEFSGIHNRLNEKNDALKQEIKKREALDQEARRVDRENRAIIDSVSDIIFETDIDGKILFLNAQWPKITGFDVDQSVGLELFSILHPNDQHDVRDEFYGVIRGKKETFRKFTRLRTADGTFRAAELSVSMINYDGEAAGRVVGTFTDIEERRRAERALSEAERKYRNIVQNAAGGIFQVTPEGLYLSANPAMADILGYESPEQLLREVKNATRDVYCDQNMRASFIRELEAKNMIANHEVLVKRRDGEDIWVNENIHTVRDDVGNILYFEGSIEDISARKISALELQKAKAHSDMANRAKSEFLANMSHELRTPLNSIIGFSEMIKSEVLGKIEHESYLEYAADINASGQSLLNIINEILDVSKIEAGERELNESQIRIDRIVGVCIDLLATKIDEGGVSVTNQLEGMPEIIGEDLSIKQVLMNLLSNAVKFTPKGGRVSLSYEVGRDGRLHVSVTDTGIGLDEAEIQKALSPFGQLDSELDRDGSGTGLGLTLADALLELHGAKLELVSQKGIGTTATAIFPKERVVIKKAPQVKSEDVVSS